jgi:hypothetical protein
MRVLILRDAAKGERDLMVRSVAQRRVSNHGPGPSFETRAQEGALLRMRKYPDCSFYFHA